ncbi:MAG: Zn-dependent exopeptidase M28 [Oscillospiraceae bacterium]|jgi:hypothetical protein|nr:Zn-dependent exopeptidase M28 [Oscillospiraceae bacterium]
MKMILKRHTAYVLIAAVILLALIAGLINLLQSEVIDQNIFAQENINVSRSPLTNINDNPYHGRVAVDYIIFLNDNFNDRFSYTMQEMHTAVWLVEELLAMGFSWDDIEVQEFISSESEAMENTDFFINWFIILDNSPFANFGARSSKMSQNIVLTLPGQSEEVIVVGAHYDSVFYPGASDNASGVALMLESAQRMMNLNHYYTIKYVFFGAEELGLYGSFHYVNNLTQAEHENILFMVNSDILLEGESLFYMAGYDANGESGANHITETWDAIAKEINTHYSINLIPWPEAIFGPSDQLAFLPKGHTVMLLMGLDGEKVATTDVNTVIFDMARVVHSPRDDIHYILQEWPDKANANMHGFSLFLDEILLAAYEY